MSSILAIDLGPRIGELLSTGALDIPLPGGGATPLRHQLLAQWGREDLSVARIAEAHTDATAILQESRRAPKSATLYGVWASDGPHSRVVAIPLADGSWQLDGTKQYCSGATLVQAALVTAHHNDAVLMFEVFLDTDGVSLCSSNWASPAFSDTATLPVEFRRVIVAATALVGGPGWYLTRPGFWHGAIGPAACWAGGAMALIDAAIALNRKDSHSRAHVGAMQSMQWGFEAVLAQAGQQIDDDPLDSHARAHGRALKVRHLIERWCTEVLDRFGRATGPQLLAFDAASARQHAALTLYIRQCHAERDLEAIPR